MQRLLCGGLSITRCFWREMSSLQLCFSMVAARGTSETRMSVGILVPQAASFLSWPHCLGHQRGQSHPIFLGLHVCRTGKLSARALGYFANSSLYILGFWDWERTGKKIFRTQTILFGHGRLSFLSASVLVVSCSCCRHPAIQLHRAAHNWCDSKWSYTMVHAHTHRQIYIYTHTWIYGAFHVFSHVQMASPLPMIGNSTWLLKISIVLSEHLVLQGESFVDAPFPKQC